MVADTTSPMSHPADLTNLTNLISLAHNPHLCPLTLTHPHPTLT